MVRGPRVLPAEHVAQDGAFTAMAPLNQHVSAPPASTASNLSVINTIAQQIRTLERSQQTSFPAPSLF